MSTIASLYGTPNFSNAPLRFGTEYEIEDVADWNYNGDWVGKYGISSEEDHSLRNSGKEFKTKPLTFQDSLDCFEALHSNLSLGSDPYSERTSTHVHMNMGHFTEEQVKQLLLTYALYEPLFFSYVGMSRQESIFCVPLSYTSLPNHYAKPLAYLYEKWHKYTAFNLLPLHSFGTVEFRHLGGTGDFFKYERWLTAIKNLHNCIYVDKFDPLSFIKEGGNYIEHARNLFPMFTEGLSTEQIKTMLKDSLIDIKLATGGI